MKFRFCGDGDCPDWVLAEIHSTISTLTSMKLRLVLQMVAKSIIENTISEDKLHEICASTKKEVIDMKSIISCLRYLLVNAAKYNTDAVTFDAELQQLGLPKEHSTVICAIFSDYMTSIRQKLSTTCLSVNELKDVSGHIPSNTADCVQLQLSIEQEEKNNYIPIRINIHKIDLKILLKELITVQNILQKCEYETKF